MDAINLLMFFVLAILVFLIAREIFTWYWKINKMVDLLERIEWRLRRIEKNTHKSEEEKPVGEADSKQQNSDN